MLQDRVYVGFSKFVFRLPGHCNQMSILKAYEIAEALAKQKKLPLGRLNRPLSV